MALVRLLKRRVSYIGIVLVATTLWIFYLIISAPAASDRRYENSLLPHHHPQHMKESVTRKVVAPPLEPAFNKPVIRRPPSNIGEPVEVPDKPGIPPPPPSKEDGAVEKVKPFENKAINPSDNKISQTGGDKDTNKNVNIENKDGGENQPTSDNKNEEKSKNEGKVENEAKDNIETKEKVVQESVNVTKKANNDTAHPVFKEVEEKVKQIGESVKNKTIEKLVDFGVIKKHEYEKLVYAHTHWSLNLSVEDIGNIMKDTEYFQKKQNLTEMAYQPLLQPNSTSIVNVTSLPFGFGYCECKDLSCLCCVRIFNKRMRLNSTACATITFSSKLQELHYEFQVDKKPYFERKIAAEFPPKICLESQGKAAGMCTLFSNVTAKVNIANEDHKIHLSGCMEFDLTLYNRTVSAFPVGCFQIPGPHTKEKEEHNNAPNVGNFMP